jgi:hypothetical protein
LYKSFHYKPSFEELDIQMDNIIKTMGYSNGNIPEGFQQILNELVDTAKKIVTPECGFVILPQNSCSAGSGIVVLDEIEFNTDKIVAGPLKKISGAALFIATIGLKFDTWSKDTFENGDPLAGYIIDLLGSEIAESIADWLENKIRIHSAKQNLKCSNRYSPGYCGWSVAEQQKLFKFIPKDFCGITLTDSSLMKPHKSVSGIIGISPDIKWKDYPCDVCTVEHCYKNRDKKLNEAS